MSDKRSFNHFFWRRRRPDKRSLGKGKGQLYNYILPLVYLCELFLSDCLLSGIYCTQKWWQRRIRGQWLDRQYPPKDKIKLYLQRDLWPEKRADWRTTRWCQYTWMCKTPYVFTRRVSKTRVQIQIQSCCVVWRCVWQATVANIKNMGRNVEEASPTLP